VGVCVTLCGLETSRMRRPWAALGRRGEGGGGVGGKCGGMADGVEAVSPERKRVGGGWGV